MSKKLCWCTFQIFVLLMSSCKEDYNHSLGNNLSLWEGDKKEDRIIVYCEGSCHGGIYVIPSYKNHYDSTGHYAEYVKETTSDKKWVIAKTFQIKENKENYYIISKEFNIENLDCAKANCDSILQSHVTGPMTLTEFENKKKSMNIALDLNKHL